MSNKHVINNSAPAITSTFLNNVENALVNAISDAAITSSSGILTATGLVLGANLLKFAARTTVKNGSTSGTMTVYEFCASGSALKVVIVAYSNYKNANATANSVALQAPFTQRAHIHSGNCQGTQFISSGSTVNVSCTTTLGGTGDGSATTSSKLNAYSIAETAGAFDTIKEPGSNAVSRTGNITIIGF